MEDFSPDIPKMEARRKMRQMASSASLAASGLLLAVTMAACLTPTGGATVALEGSLWILETYVDLQEETHNVLPRTQVSAVFEEGKISGSDGCNSYFGDYQLDGSKLTIQPLGSTMMACPELVTVQAEAVTAGLAATSTFATEGRRLILKDASGKAILTFQAQSQDLAGTSWNAIGVNNGQQAVVSLILETEITAVFSDDGTVTGSAGCNTYNAPYEIEGKQIKIGPVATTRMFCAEPEGVMEQEGAYVAALEKSTTYEPVGTNLTLRDAQGATQIEYVRK